MTTPPAARSRLPSDAVSCAVVIIATGLAEDDDTAGALAKARLHEGGHVVEFYRIVEDDPEKVRGVLVHLAGQVDLVLTAGATGFARNDAAIEVAESLIRKPLPGFGELLRALLYERIGPPAMLTRALAGTFGLPTEPTNPATTLLFCCPADDEAVALALDRLILPDLRKLVSDSVW